MIQRFFTLDGGYRYNPQNQRQYLRKEEKDQIYITFQRQERKSKGFHYYGGMSHLGLTDIIKVTGTGTVTAKKYIASILPKLIFKHQKEKEKKNRIGN